MEIVDENLRYLDGKWDFNWELTWKLNPRLKLYVVGLKLELNQKKAKPRRWANAEYLVNVSSYRSNLTVSLVKRADALTRFSGSSEYIEIVNLSWEVVEFKLVQNIPE